MLRKSSRGRSQRFGVFRMRELKPGDRVRVEFDGVVFGYGIQWCYMKHAMTGEVVTVKTDDCTLIEPEIVLPEVPGTIVQVDPLNKCGQRSTWYFESDGLWGPVGHLGRYRTEDLIVNCHAYGYRVIPAAEAVTE